MQSPHRSDAFAELGHPDFFADLEHPNGIDDVPLSAMFPPRDGISTLDIPDIIQAEKKLIEARSNLVQLEKTYSDLDCQAVLESKSSMELIGSVASWTSIFMPAVPQNRYTVALGIVINTIGKLATDTANEIAKSEVIPRCLQCNADIGRAGNTLEAAQERYETEVKKVFGVYSQNVQRKKTSETRIRDWQIYAYKLEVYCHQMDPTRPKPSVPVYSFKATPVPTERTMRLGAQILQQAVSFST